MNLNLLAQKKKVQLSVEILEASDHDLIITVDRPKTAGLFSEKQSLYRLEGTKRKLVPFQLYNNQVNWIIEGPVKQGIIGYEIKQAKKNIKSEIVKALNQDGKLVVEFDTLKLLTYQFSTVYPPKGIDTAYKRSAFIHPLNTPHNQTLTRIQPSDHYHHYGIWNPWTRVLFEGDTVDFWNLKDRKGTVRFKQFTSQTEGPVFCEYEAEHEHVAFKKGGSEKVALIELQKVRVYKPGNNQYIVDLTIIYRCATESPFKILEYRYAGLGWRATAEWNKDNSEVLTSEGKNRKNADGSLARWFVVQGKLGNDYGGIEIMSHPDNYNHPEPLRVWPENMYDRGDVFAMFAPTKNKDWLLEPGNTYTLKYRFLIFNGALNVNLANRAWRHYANIKTQIKIE